MYTGWATYGLVCAFGAANDGHVKALHELNFTNPFHALGPRFYTEVRPVALTQPELVRADPAVAELIGLDPQALYSDALLRAFSGADLLPHWRPLAQHYAGHQFGHFNPFLGDGRVVLFGSVRAAGCDWELSLKGAGKTPYARGLDGRAGLRECLAEFECSRRLAERDIPATRCLCVIAGSERVYRQGFDRTAVLVRVAPTHIRFGTFENYYFQRDTAALRDLADFVIEHHYPHCRASGERRYVCLLRQVVQRTAQLVARWQHAGFVHGMMNTDNQSIVGITLDLGAAAFNPALDSTFVSSAADEHGRYAFAQQPVMGLWNCNVLARALSPLIAVEDLRAALSHYETDYLRYFESLRP